MRGQLDEETRGDVEASGREREREEEEEEEEENEGKREEKRAAELYISRYSSTS